MVDNKTWLDLANDAVAMAKQSLENAFEAYSYAEKERGEADKYSPLFIGNKKDLIRQCIQNLDTISV